MYHYIFWLYVVKRQRVRIWSYTALTFLWFDQHSTTGIGFDYAVVGCFIQSQRLLFLPQSKFFTGADIWRIFNT
ncbi:hypothetical protein BB779_16450 [Pseudomonas viridiflava]|nr:hypothetical protein BB779_16450 [Pseudomonas viridiflava]